MKLTFATGNSGKLREASEILGEGFDLVSLADVGIKEDIPETGDTLRDNSIQKAQYLYERIGCDCFADDTGLEGEARRARFKSVITLIINGETHLFEGTLEGVIAHEKSGNGGFGYDPIFIADEYPGLTLADITEEQKNDISHRGKALRAMAEWLKSRNS